MPKVEITIGKTNEAPGVPVLLDWDESIQQHVDRFMANCIAFPTQRYQPEISVQERHAQALLKSPYPDLPPCKIGEFQWPAGLSRYGRAMYVVDWRSLLEIADRAWGYEIEREEPAEGEEEGAMIKPDFGPAFNWGSKNDPVNLHFNSDMIEYPEGQEPESGQPAWTKSTDPYVMYALPPIPLSEQYDVWVIRLVDIRYFRLHNGQFLHGTSKATFPYDGDWEDLIDSMQRMFGPSTGANNTGDILGEISTFTIDASISSDLSAFGVPSRPLFDTRIPLLHRFEAAALTIGGRFFYDGFRTLTLRSHNNGREEVTALIGGADAIATAGKDTIAGGFAGQAVGVRRWRYEDSSTDCVVVQPIYFDQLILDKERLALLQQGTQLESTWAIHPEADGTPETPPAFDARAGVRTATTAKFNTFKAAYEGRTEYWNEVEYCLTYPGVFEYRKCCYTDYYSITNNGRDCYTLVKSLPIDWRPRCLFAQPKCHFEASGVFRGVVRNVYTQGDGNRGIWVSVHASGGLADDGIKDENNARVHVRTSWYFVDSISVGDWVWMASQEVLQGNNETTTQWHVVAYDCAVTGGGDEEDLPTEPTPRPDVRLSSAGSWMYVGSASAGALESDAVWQIYRFALGTLLVDPADIQHADGNDNFDNVWNNRTSLSYSVIPEP
jgi:hypothetical protein